MRVILIAVILLSAVLSFVGVAATDEDLDDESLRTVQGKVINIDAGKSLITIAGVVKQTFLINNETTLVEYDKDIKLSDIKIGSYVTVEYMIVNGRSSPAISVKVEYENADTPF